jgi:hypothetical protein
VGRANAELHAGERTGDRAVHVSDNDHIIRLSFAAHVIEAHHHPSGLFGMGTAPYAKEPRRMRHLQVLEEGIRHRRIIMLSGVDDVVFEPIRHCLECTMDRCDLHEIGPRADD